VNTQGDDMSAAAKQTTKTAKIYWATVCGLSVAALAALSTIAVQPASAADMPVKAPLASPVFSWTGFYIGGNVGYGRSSVTFTVDAPLVPASGTGTAHNSSFVGGGQIGYNWQFNPNWMLGIEANVIGGKFDQTTTVIDSAGATRNLISSVKTIWDVAGRLGYASNNWLFYGKGGYAQTSLALSLISPASVPAGVQGSSSNSVSGFVAGAGIEYGLTRNWIVGIEYDYYGFRNHDQLGVNLPVLGTFNFRSIGASVQTVTGRVSYKF